LTIFGKKFQIIGVMKKQGKTMTGFDFDNGMILTYLYVSSIRNIDNNAGNGFIDPMIMVKSRPGIDLKEMKYEIKSVLRSARLLKPKDKDNFSFNQLDAIQNSIDSIFAMFNVGGFIIAFFSLLVGSFGIANIMFVSVKERTSQIGLKKALGAKPNTILAEFLIESIILCLLGGLVGILFVFVLSKVVSNTIDFPLFMSFFNFMIGVGVSVLVGIIAGIIPAIRASKLNPVEAIRS
jgi:putative ABC transport system permease protein